MDSPSHLHPSIVPDPQLPESCLYPPPVTDACHQSGGDGLGDPPHLCTGRRRWGEVGGEIDDEEEIDLFPIGRARPAAPSPSTGAGYEMDLGCRCEDECRGKRRLWCVLKTQFNLEIKNNRQIVAETRSREEPGRRPGQVTPASTAPVWKRPQGEMNKIEDVS